MNSDIGMLRTEADTLAAHKCSLGLKEGFICTYNFPGNISLKSYLC